MRKEIAIGFLIGILATIAGFVLYIELFSEFGFQKTLQMIDEGKLYGEVISLGAVANFFVFFIFIKKKQDYRARGVLMATIFEALLVLAVQFM